MYEIFKISGHVRKCLSGEISYSGICIILTAPLNLDKQATFQALAVAKGSTQTVSAALRKVTRGEWATSRGPHSPLSRALKPRFTAHLGETPPGEFKQEMKGDTGVLAGTFQAPSSTMTCLQLKEM